MARIPYVDPERAPDDVRDTLARTPDLNVFRLVAHAETAFRPWLRFGAVLLSDLALDPLQRELAIIHVSRLCEADYEWVQHAAITLAVGGTQEQVDAVDRGDIEAACFDEAQTAILRLTGETVRNVRVSQETFDAAMEHLDPRRLVELLLVVGQYAMLARVMEVLEIDPDAAAGPDDLIRVQREARES